MRCRRCGVPEIRRRRLAERYRVDDSFGRPDVAFSLHLLAGRGAGPLGLDADA
jgi:hypothetical protein